MYTSFRVQLHAIPEGTDVFDLAERLKELLVDEFEPEFDDDIQIDFEEYSE
jgi:hypothetical protein